MRPRKRQPYGQWSPDVRALEVIGGKWTLLIVRDLLSGPKRFVELQARLPGISTEQLRIRLAEMVGDGLLERRRFKEMPPRVEYSLTPRGQDLRHVIGAVSDWGARWGWGPPREGELVEIDAALRSVTAARREDMPDGVLELRVGRARLTCEVVDGSCTLSEGPSEAPDATISGSHTSWVRALMPGPSRGGLRIQGDRELARAFIERALQRHDGALRRAAS